MAWKANVQTAMAALRKEEVALQAQLESLQQRINLLQLAGGAVSGKGKGAPKSRRLSAEGRAAISAGARKRWAKYRKAKKAAAK